MKYAALLAFCVAASVQAEVPKSIEKSVVVDVPVATAWRAWSTSEGLQSWLCARAAVDLKLNGRYEIEFDIRPAPGVRGSEGAQVLSFLPERMLSFSWNAPPSQPTMRMRRTFVVLQFAPAGDGKTKVDLTHAGWREGREWEETRAYFDEAWGGVMDAFKEFCQKGGKISPAAPNAEPPAKPDEALKAMASMIGGVWRGEVKDAQGKPMVIEFTYRRHRDGIGVIGEGWIGKGRKDAMHVRTQFGIDPVTRSTYYLDTHASDIVYWGHVAKENKDLVFVFGPAGGDMNAFSSRSRFVDQDHLATIIRNTKGEEIVGFTLVRVK